MSNWLHINARVFFQSIQNYERDITPPAFSYKLPMLVYHVYILERIYILGRPERKSMYQQVEASCGGMDGGGFPMSHVDYKKW